VLDPQKLEALANVGWIVALHTTALARSSVWPNVHHDHGVIAILRRVSRRRCMLLGFLAVAACPAALSACGGTESSSTASSNPAGAAVEPLPTRKTRPKAVEPVAGESAEYAALPTEEPTADAAPPPAGASAPLGKRKRSNGPTSDVAISQAEVRKEGVALPPIEAPDEVRRIIEAGNQIARTPYLWGGGHGKWLDKGYDCSGSVSYALAAAGLLGGPLDSGRLMGWGKPGKGKWVTVYTNPGHVFLVVAGVRFDTSGNRVTGSRWQASMRGTGGFVARHPPGL
jgi:cell wall-associated NlpC family hydrolase